MSAEDPSFGQRHRRDPSRLTIDYRVELPDADVASRPPGQPTAPAGPESQKDARNAITGSTPLQFVPGVGPLRAELFERLGVRKAIDLLFLFPRTYQDVAPYQTITELESGIRATVVGQVVDMDHRFAFDGRATVGILLAIEGGGYVRCVWYNQPFRKEQFRRGMRIIATGIPKPTGVSFEMRHPETLALDEGAPLPQARPVPLYPLTEGLQQRHVFTAVGAALEHLLPSVEEALPDSVRLKAGELLSSRAKDLQ